MGIHARSPQAVLLYGMGARVEGRAALPRPKSVAARQQLERAEAAAWLLGPRCSLPSSPGENEDSSSPATQHRADLSQGTQGSQPSHPHVGDTQRTPNTQEVSGNFASAFRRILAAKPLEFYFSEELENARRVFHYEL